MRWLRASVLVAALMAASRLLASGVAGPLLDCWQVLSDPGWSRESPSSGLAALVAGVCAALLLGAWVWLLAAVGSCLRESLGGGSSPATAAVPSALRPPLVRAVVAACLGAATLTSPAAQGQVHPGHAHARPGEVSGTVADTRAASLQLLDGLPVPDRATGRPGDQPSDRDRPRPTSPWPGPAEDPIAEPRLHVRPGDSLWTLTAGLLPARAPLAAVARGWRLLYDANRAVVGPDPDLLQPGQTLRVDRALLALVPSTERDRRSR